MKVSTAIRLPVDQVWQLVADRSAQQIWLGPGAYVPIAETTRAWIRDEGGCRRSGLITRVEKERSIECRLAPDSSWLSGREPVQLTLSLDETSNGATVTVEETGPADAEPVQSSLEDVEAFWRSALSRLEDLAGHVRRRRRNPRQAVIIIHGIGEQYPGVTLRNFLEGVLGGSDSSVEQWSKPDRMSPLFELRQVTLRASRKQDRPTTDVFELYWAHLIRDTTVSQVSSWMRHLFLRRSVPARFRTIWLVGWVFVAAVLVFAALGYWPAWASYLTSGGILVLALTLFWRLLGKSFVINSLGDAARYLTPRPANIEHRQAIREAGVDLLDTLHAQGKYDRIVLVGHSLGSVIAYDIITQYWIRTHRRHLKLDRVSNAKVAELERRLDEPDVQAAQKLQHEAWQAARANAHPWLITDLVTLGSPLSMADFLMAPSAEDFMRAKDDRELPTCPPVFEIQGGQKRVSFDLGYTDRFGVKDRTFRYLHHAAPFAITRWTNLHFANRLTKDPIGGPVAPKFGPWVRDVKLEAPRRHPWFLHTRYWHAEGNEDNVRILLEALRLDSGQELLSELGRHSPLMYLPGAL